MELFTEQNYCLPALPLSHFYSLKTEPEEAIEFCFCFVFVFFSCTITDKQPSTLSKKEWLQGPLEICSTLDFNPDQNIHLENKLSFNVPVLN